MGTDNSPPGPVEADAVRSHIPVSALQEAHSLFAERTGTCGGTVGRCSGFTGIANNYDSDGQEHSFIYLVYYYVSNGNQLREWVIQDAARGDTLLLRKYNWVKNYIFRGVEFN
jgi:hypothetical protein